MESFGQIYMITELDTNKIYIGQTNMKIAKRWQTYKSRPTKGHLISQHMHARGFEYFKIEDLMDGVSREELNKWEKFFITTFKSYDSKYGYNKSYGGFGMGAPTTATIQKLKDNHNPGPSRKGIKMSEETKRKLSVAKKGKKRKLSSKQREHMLIQIKWLQLRRHNKTETTFKEYLVLQEKMK